MRINYAAQNGHPYLAVGRVLIERGIVPADEMTMDKIRTFISEHPEEGREFMRMNRSYIFFREVEELARTPSRSARRACRSRATAPSPSIARSTCMARHSGSTPNYR